MSHPACYSGHITPGMLLLVTLSALSDGSRYHLQLVPAKLGPGLAYEKTACSALTDREKLRMKFIHSIVDWLR